MPQKKFLSSACLQLVETWTHPTAIALLHTLKCSLECLTGLRLGLKRKELEPHQELVRAHSY